MAYDENTICPIMYRYANNDSEDIDINTVLDSLGYSKQNQPCKNDVFCYLLRPETPVTSHAELTPYLVAPEDVPVWISDIAGTDIKLATLAHAQVLCRHANWATVLELP